MPARTSVQAWNDKVAWEMEAAEREQKEQAAQAKNQLKQMQQQQNLETLKRESEARAYLDEIIAMYQPGGTFGQGYETLLGRQKTKDVASGTQALVSSGLFNTTQTAGLGTKWEEQIGMPARAKLEDVRYGALSQALGQKAQFVTDIQQSPIDYAMLANLIAQGQSF